jgi:two-component system, NarL family, response regulator NreC
MIADDHEMVREGFASLVSDHENLEVISTVSNGREAVEAALEYRPDIILMDIGMPQLNGIDASRKILSECPQIKIIGISMYSSNIAVIEMLRAGAAGYIHKMASFSEVVAAIDVVLSGNRYISPSIANIVVSEAVYKDSDAATNVFQVLSAREREVLQLFAEGKTTKEIAYLLEISGRTVDAHRKNVMEKLGLNTLADLTRYALSEHIINPLEFRRDGQ